jgi:hypothetical protein
MTRAEIVQRLNSMRGLGRQANDISRLDSAISDVISRNYFPLLPALLSERMAICLEQKNFAQYVADSFIRLSHLVRLPNPTAAFEDLITFLRHMQPLTITVAPKYFPLFPIAVSAHYDRDRVVAGTLPHVHLSLRSRLPCPVKLDSVSLVVIHDDARQEEVFELSTDHSLWTHGVTTIDKVRKLPPAISQEAVEGVIFRFGPVSLRLQKHFCGPLHVSPDISACRIEWSPPKRCVIGADLPLTVVLHAADQRLEQPLLWFTPEAPITISGRYKGVDIGSVRAKLPDIDPHGECALELTVKSLQEVCMPVEMVVAFGTALSGTGEFKTSIPFDFQNPFVVATRYFDAGGQELMGAEQPLVFENESYIAVETSLTNNLECPIRVLSIGGTLSALDFGDLPAVIESGEVFTFVGHATKPGQADIVVGYAAELVGRCDFRWKTQTIDQLSKGLTFALEAPPAAVRGVTFEARVVIEKRATWLASREESDVAMIGLDVQVAAGFFIEGPLKRVVVVFAGQKKIIPIKFLALDAGPATLPAIVLTEVGGPAPKTRRLIAPIAITYQ